MENEAIVEVLGSPMHVTRRVFLGQHSRWQVASIEVDGVKINNRQYTGHVRVTAKRDHWETGPTYWVRDLMNDMGNPITEKAIEKLQDALRGALKGNPLVADPTREEKREHVYGEVYARARYDASRLLYEARRVVWSNEQYRAVMTEIEAEEAALLALREYLEEQGVTL